MKLRKTLVVAVIAAATLAISIARAISTDQVEPTPTPTPIPHYLPYILKSEKEGTPAPTVPGRPTPTVPIIRPTPTSEKSPSL